MMRRVLCAGLLLASSVRAQGRISGFVTDSAHRPLANAEVIVMEPRPGRSVRTDSAGQFVIDGLAPGTYNIRARRLGFYVAQSRIALTNGQPKIVIFELLARPQVLAPIEVTAKCVRWTIEGFACRQAKGGRGVFMDEEAIDAKHALEIHELFRDVPGLRVEDREARSKVGWRCTQTLVNGKLPGPSNQRPNWPSDLIGIEIYLNPDSVPGEYSHFVWMTEEKKKTSYRCGIINYWTSGRPRYAAGTRKK